MADDKTKQGKADDVRILASDEHEIRYVMERTGASRDAVLAAVQAHGPMRAAVMAALGKG